jgi:hypothetical protein
MADPVGFVESHGGIGQFLQRQLMPSTAPIPALRLTPTALTPVPGTLSPLYGQGTPSPTTLSAAAGEVHPPKSKLPFMIGGGVVIAAATVGVMLVLSKGGAKDAEGSGSSAAVKVLPGSDIPPPPAGSDKTVAKGSDTHVATGSDTHAAKGSDTNVAPGNGSAVVVVPPPVEPMTTKIAVHSKPPGAEILLDGIDQNKVTDATLEVPRAKKTVTITLRLKNYDELVVKDLALDKPELTETLALRKKHAGGGTATVVVPGKGSGSATTTTTKGNGSTKSCDTCLERPD